MLSVLHGAAARDLDPQQRGLLLKPSAGVGAIRFTGASVSIIAPDLLPGTRGARRVSNFRFFFFKMFKDNMLHQSCMMNTPTGVLGQHPIFKLIHIFYSKTYGYCTKYGN